MELIPDDIRKTFLIKKKIEGDKIFKTEIIIKNYTDFHEKNMNQ